MAITTTKKKKRSRKKKAVAQKEKPSTVKTRKPRSKKRRTPRKASIKASAKTRKPRSQKPKEKKKVYSGSSHTSTSCSEDLDDFRKTKKRKTTGYKRMVLGDTIHSIVIHKPISKCSAILRAFKYGNVSNLAETDKHFEFIQRPKNGFHPGTFHTRNLSKLVSLTYGKAK